jgi:solute carrier family 25 carnitine/acylcarnitine transporter 20/29
MPEIYSSPVKCFKDIVKYEGVAGLYKGLLSPVLAQFFIGALSFAANSATMKILEPGLKKGEPGEFHNSFIAGCVGGFAQCVVLVPTDLIKCKMQTDQVAINGKTTIPQFASSYDCLKQIVRQDGFRGLYRGFVSTASREVPAFGIYFGSYRQMMKALTPENSASPPVAAILLSGGIAGSLSWGVVYPVDVIKTNVQLSTTTVDPVTHTAGGTSSAIMDGSRSTGNPNSMLNVTRTLYRRYGYSIFFRGFSTAVVRAFPVNSAVFFFYELFRGHLGI